MVEDKDEKKFKKKVKIELLKQVSAYQKSMAMMSCDLPLSALCLSKKIENALLKAGYDRVYDLLDLDLIEIKGIGKIGRRELTARLHQFIAVS
jgi:hypothetical protein